MLLPELVAVETRGVSSVTQVELVFEIIAPVTRFQRYSALRLVAEHLHILAGNSLEESGKTDFRRRKQEYYRHTFRTSVPRTVGESL